jgi:hypothetical protein
VAAKAPPSHVFADVSQMEAEKSGSLLSFNRGGGISYPDWIFGPVFAAIDIAAGAEI